MPICRLRNKSASNTREGDEWDHHRDLGNRSVPSPIYAERGSHRILLLGTALLLKPGIISGGPLTHECPLSRSVGYFLEPLIMLAPFAKRPFQLTLRGITTDDHDLSVSVPVQAESTP